MRDQNIEDLLNQLKPSIAPAALRSRVLASLADDSPAVALPATWLRTHCGSLAVAVLLLIAISFWIVSGQVQQLRLAKLLGPSSAERRVEVAMQRLGPIEDEASRVFFRKQFERHYGRVSPATGELRLHSVTPEIISYLETASQNETHPKNSNLHRGNSTYLRRNIGLEKSPVA